MLSRSRITNRNASIMGPRSIARFRACWTTHAPVGLAVTPAMYNRRVPCSMKINTYSRRNSTVSTCKKSPGDDPVRLGGPELTPGRAALWRGIDPGPLQDLPYRRISDLMA
jgi:hypothetical protein